MRAAGARTGTERPRANGPPSAATPPDRPSFRPKAARSCCNTFKADAAVMITDPATTT